MKASDARRFGFTMIEIFGVLILISLLIMLLLPAVQSSREMARRTSCANNLMQVSVGTQMYHGAFEQLPTQLSGTDGSPVKGADNDRRLSLYVGLLPFIGQLELADVIRNPLAENSVEFGTDDWGEMMMMGDEDYGEDFGDDFGDDVEVAMMADPSVGVKTVESEATWPIGGPEPFQGSYPPWRFEVPVLRCPSDPGTGSPGLGRTNYAACLGDGMLAADSGPMRDVKGTYVVDAELAEQTEAAMRGAFVPRVVTRLDDITDGLSSTILLSEIATDLGDRDTRTNPVACSDGDALLNLPNWGRDSGLISIDRPRFWSDNSVSPNLEANVSARRGLRWSDGMPLYTGMNTILPPNREIVLGADRDDTWGLLTASSRHQGGAHVAFADGSVRFMSDSVDAGNANAPTVYPGSDSVPGSESPYGIWGAMGTRNSAELFRGFSQEL